MRTHHIRKIHTIEIKHEDDGFALEMIRSVGEDYHPEKYVVHLPEFFWIGHVADLLWKVLKQKKELWERLIANATASLKGS